MFVAAVYSATTTATPTNIIAAATTITMRQNEI